MRSSRRASAKNRSFSPPSSAITIGDKIEDADDLDESASTVPKKLCDVIGTKEEDMVPLEEDVYNMLFIAHGVGRKAGRDHSGAARFAFLIWIIKLGLNIFLLIDLYGERGHIFPDSSEVASHVRFAQLFLIPVNIAVQEEIVISFWLFANVRYCDEVKKFHPGATQTQFRIANTMRFIDGFMFLFVNSTLLFQAKKVLEAFLNFAALQFIFSIDNVAFELARMGYLTVRLEQVANEVSETKLPLTDRGGWFVYMDSFLLLGTLVLLIVIWLVTWILNL